MAIDTVAVDNTQKIMTIVAEGIAIVGMVTTGVVWSRLFTLAACGRLNQREERDLELGMRNNPRLLQAGQTIRSGLEHADIDQGQVAEVVDRAERAESA